MAVYPTCEKCGCRRERCQLQATHKRYTAWVADWKPGRGKEQKRLRETFGSDLKNPKELAEDRFSTWKTDVKRGKLGFKDEKVSAVMFETVADEWWTQRVVVEGRIKDPKRSEKSRFEMWKKLFEGSTVNSIELEDGEDWITERRENGIAINTINRDLKPLRWILDYAVEKKYIEMNPLTALKGLKNGNIHDRWMTQEESDRLVKAALDLEDFNLADFMAVGLNTGFRLGNLKRLTSRDIDGELLIAKQTKSGKPYGVPITADLDPILRRLVREHPTGPLLSVGHIGDRFRAAARKAKLYKDKSDPERVTIHTLRHTFAVLYLKRGGDIYKLSKLLGHASVAITDQIYARFCPKEKLKEAAHMSTPVPQREPMLKVI